MKTELDLGKLLGRREAFNMVAARCSAAEATILREVRDQRLWEGYSVDWGAFCAEHLHISKTVANRIIQLLNEFGIQYFEIAQLTRISPETYRAIAPSIHDGALHTEGGPIALIPENAEKVAAAVAELRKQTPREAAAPPVPVDALRERCRDLFTRVAAIVESGENPAELWQTLYDTYVKLSELVRDLPRRAA